MCRFQDQIRSDQINTSCYGNDVRVVGVFPLGESPPHALDVAPMGVICFSLCGGPDVRES